MNQNYSSQFTRFTRYLTLVSICTLTLLMLSFSVHASGIPSSSQTIPLPQSVNPSALGDGLGRGVAIDGDTALVGAAEALHVFVRSGTTWSYQAALTTGDATPLLMGDIDGDTAVGYNDDYNSRGSVFVFVRSGTTWSQQVKLTIDELTYPLTVFSGPIVIDGNRLLAGATDYSINGDKPRFRIFAYNRVGTTWTLEYQFTPSGYSMGRDITLDGNLMVLFNEVYTGGDGPGGSIGVYQHNGTEWVYVTSDGNNTGDPDVPDSQAASSGAVAVSGNTIASVGYIYNYLPDEWWVNELYSVVFVYTLSGTTLTRQALLKPTNNLGHHYYISDVNLDGDTLLVTVRDPDTNVDSVLYYKRTGTTWTLQSTINKSPSGSDLSGTTALLGAESESAAYVYVLNGTVWSQQARLTLTSDPTELLINGGFEVGLAGSSHIPVNWKLKSMTSNPYPNAHRDCSYPAHGGSCSLTFNNNLDKVIQNVDLTIHSLKAGDKIRLTGFYRKYGSNTTNYPITVSLFVSYTSLPEDQSQITVKKTTNDWTELPKISYTLKAKPTRVRVVIQGNGNYNNPAYVDDISLRLVSSSPLALETEGSALTQSETTLPLPSTSGLTGLGK